MKAYTPLKLSQGYKLVASTRPAKYEHLAMQWRIRKKNVTLQRHKLRKYLKRLKEALDVDPANELLIAKRIEARAKIREHNAELKVLQQAQEQLEKMESQAWEKLAKKRSHH